MYIYAISRYVYISYTYRSNDQILCIDGSIMHMVYGFLVSLSHSISLSRACRCACSLSLSLSQELH